MKEVRGTTVSTPLVKFKTVFIQIEGSQYDIGGVRLTTNSVYDQVVAAKKFGQLI